jgi:hypothetical protein
LEASVAVRRIGSGSYFLLIPPGSRRKMVNLREMAAVNARRSLPQRFQLGDREICLFCDNNGLTILLSLKEHIPKIIPEP